MESRDGLIEFRVVEKAEKSLTKGTHHKLKVVEYRQCFKGIWTPWKVAITLGD